MGKMNVVSFFAGCGGLDLGFEQAGFHVVWANEFEPYCRATYERNHPNTEFVLGDVCKIDPNSIPNCDGFIGGPPCQSWSIAGKQKGLEDNRGLLFLKYIELINIKKPKFFVIENVKGMLGDKFKDVFEDFVNRLKNAGYDVQWALLDAVNYRIPQNRERVFFVGFRKGLNINYAFPNPTCEKPVTLERAIGDITEEPFYFNEDKEVKQSKRRRLNHDTYSGFFGDYYKRANRRRDWTKPSFTIHAMADKEPLHPSSPKMHYINHEEWAFGGKYKDCRRLSVRECARLQTFPDSFEFIYTNIKDGYKMIGNAVPPRMAYILASSIKEVLEKNRSNNAVVLVGFYKNAVHRSKIIQNQLYYVRADGRHGSLCRSDIPELPEFILLHNHGRKQLYALQKEEPQLKTGEELRNMGFPATGTLYLCFKLAGVETVTKDCAIDVGYNEYVPSFTTIDKTKLYNNETINDKIDSHMRRKKLKFIDLFAGLGGFHIALTQLGCECVFASELKDDLRRLYVLNYPEMEGLTESGINKIEGDITKVELEKIPLHDILCAGFPCQPFSQAGKRQGFDDEAGRGNLFDYICKVIKVKGENKPKLLLLENVSNLKGHDEGNTWKVIKQKLDDLGYYVDAEILSPHQYGYPQHRKRIYIVGIRKDLLNSDGIIPFEFPIEHKEKKCDINTVIDEKDECVMPLTLKTHLQLKIWQQFLDKTIEHHCPIPSFPIWAMEFGANYPFEEIAPEFLSAKELSGKRGKFGQLIEGYSLAECLENLPVYVQPRKKKKGQAESGSAELISQTEKDKKKFPDWKIRYIAQNRQFYETNKSWLKDWMKTIESWDNSHQKLEWNCGKDGNGQLKDKIIQFRASGIRVKLPTYSPALNLVGTQVPILPWIKLPEKCVPHYEDGELLQYGLTKDDIQYGRYLSVKEAAILQGMQKLSFGELSSTRCYEALGNAVNTQVVELIAKNLIKLM